MLTAYGAPGTVVQVPVLNDTGSSILSLFYDDLIAMGLLQVPAYPSIGDVLITTADGSSSVFGRYMVQWRLAEPGTNIGWSAWVAEPTIFRQGFPGGCRLSGQRIRDTFYIGTGPTTATLSVSTTKGGMSSRLE